MTDFDTTKLGTFIDEAVVKTGRTYNIIEKDFWVVWLLELLFSGPYTDQLTFKGGTSLSKAYKVIDRFSEDVDLTIDRGLIDLNPEKSLEAPDLGRAQRTKRSKAFDSSVTEFIRDEFTPWLETAIEEKLTGGEGGTAPALLFDESDPLNLSFVYPRNPDTPEDIYIQPFVRLELGARGDRSPQTQKTVKSYIEESFPDVFGSKNPVSLNVLGIERTFWEKATILHSVCCRPEDKPPRERFSRHYYDVYHLTQDADLVARTVSDTDLLTAIVENKRVYFFETWDWYPTARRGTFRLVPSPAQQKFLAEDYKAMQSMIFGDTPDFEEIMDTLRSLEQKINEM
ncbi:MAG: nucleotidyl transferase AbiEii/AbiGii toxin family protein [Alphaproteobacteria bacterium]|nr:nucleotidyl transferase AbiEii/AbiGii toxin family protein [Alphaproteobacteria bacterium]